MRWVRYGIVALVGLALLAVVGWRAFRPAVSLDRSGAPYPEPVAVAPRYHGTLPEAPLFLDRRLRVYAEKRRVWTDAPVTAKSVRSPYWSYRRWPGQVVGVVAIGSGPTVVSRWSDGTVVAIDARAGRVAWEKRIAPRDGDGYTGRRTGAATVYTPDGLHLAATPDGRPVLVVAAPKGVAGYDPATGERLWHHAAACPGWTGETTYVSACGDRLDVIDAATGRTLGTFGAASPRPWGCDLGRSGCRMVRSDDADLRLGRDGALTPVPVPLSGAGFVVDGGYVEWRRDAEVRLLDAKTGAPRWQAPLAGSVVAADASGVYVVTRAYELVALDVATGAERGRVPMPGSRPWRPGHVHVHNGLAVVERIVPRPGSDDDAYYYGPTPVVLAGV